MPVPDAGALVLVTGASGYIASWISLYLLESGYAVRGTTRNEAKGRWMKDMYKSRGLDKFDFVVVPDLEDADAFDHAAIGVEAIVHTASPFHWNVSIPDDFIKPAIAGTVSVLKAAHQQPTVQRVVITSSYASILEQKEPGTTTFTEADWNDESEREVKEKGVEAWRMHWYRASKTMAERAAWGFMEDKHPSFDLATICPPYVLGPIIHEAASAEALNTSVANWFSFLVGNKTVEDAIAPAGILCDVRDVARCHVKALLSPDAAGQRFGVATRTFTIQVLLDHIQQNEQIKEAFPNMVKGITGTKVPPQNWFDCTKSASVLHLNVTSDSQTAIDMTQSLLERQDEWRRQTRQ